MKPSTVRRFVGGPWDGRPVEIKPGFPDPDAIGHSTAFPIGASYKKDAGGTYRWELCPVVLQ